MKMKHCDYPRPFYRLSRKRKKRLKKTSMKELAAIIGGVYVVGDDGVEWVCFTCSHDFG